MTDLYKTKVCPLARVMRRELKKRGVEQLKVVCSGEEPVIPHAAQLSDSGRPILGSMAFVPSAAGLLIAGEVVRDLIGKGT